MSGDKQQAGRPKHTGVLLIFCRAVGGSGLPCVGSGGEVTEHIGPEPLRSSSPSQGGSSGQSAAVGDFLSPGALGFRTSLPSRKEFLSVSHAAEPVQRAG